MKGHNLPSGLLFKTILSTILAHPRVSDWMLMSSPLATVILCLTYLLIVRVLGPLFMANREPYDLKYPMLAYNLFQTLFNGWIFLGRMLQHLRC